jgi:hypothetical protein
VSGETGGFKALICPTEPAEYFLRGDWTTQISLKCLENFACARSGFFTPRCRHCERSEAIHLAASEARMDCFVA